MRRCLILLALAAALGAARAQTQTPAAPPASGPTTPYKRINPLPPPEGPAVRRSKEATIPGDLRPERQTVPQVRIPFGKVYQGESSGSGIDDSVARCRAKRTSEERERCEAGLDNI